MAWVHDLLYILPPLTSIVVSFQLRHYAAVYKVNYHNLTKFMQLLRACSVPDVGIARCTQCIFFLGLWISYHKEGQSSCFWMWNIVALRSCFNKLLSFCSLLFTIFTCQEAYCTTCDYFMFVKIPYIYHPFVCSFPLLVLYVVIELSMCICEPWWGNDCREEMACDEADLGPGEFAEKISNQHKLQERVRVWLTLSGFVRIHCWQGWIELSRSNYRCWCTCVNLSWMNSQLFLKRYMPVLTLASLDCLHTSPKNLA